MTKTEAVSKLLDEQPTVTAKEAVALLKKKGVEINEQGFYNYKNLWKKATPKSDVPVAPKDFEAKSHGSKASVLATLQKLEELADDVGGYGELRKLIDFLEK